MRFQESEDLFKDLASNVNSFLHDLFLNDDVNESAGCPGPLGYRAAPYTSFSLKRK